MVRDEVIYSVYGRFLGRCHFYLSKRSENSITAIKNLVDKGRSQKTGTFERLYRSLTSNLDIGNHE